MIYFYLAKTKNVKNTPCVERFATGSIKMSTSRRLGTLSLSLVPLLSSFGGVRALSPLKLGGDVDTMSLGPTRLLE